MSARVSKIRVTEGGVVEVLAAGVGEVRDLPAVGAVVGASSLIGRIVTLGQAVPLTLPSDAPTGRVRARATGRKRSAGVGHEQLLFTYGAEDASADTATHGAATSGGLVFRAPMAGRFYRKTSPDKPALVEVGEVVEPGRALGLVEVMKTFHRVAYGGEGMPARVKITRALVQDGEDIAQGDALFELEVSG